MKTLFPILMLLPFALLNAQQTIQRNHFLQPDFYNQTLDGTVLANGNLVVVYSSGNLWFFGSEQVRLSCFSPKGELLWDKSAQIGGERIFGAAISPLLDTTFVLTASPSGCDYGIPQAWALYNADGVALWHSDQSTNMNWNLPILPFDAHSFLIHDSQSGFFHRLRFDGSKLDALETLDSIPLYDPRHLLLPSGDLVLTLGSSRLRQCGYGLTPKKEREFNRPVLAYDALTNGGMAVLFSDSIVLLDSNWISVKKALLPLKGQNMTAVGDRIFATTNTNGNKVLFVFDNNLQIIQQLPEPEEVATPRLSSAGGDVLFWGTSDLNGQNTAIFLKTIPVDIPAFDTCPDLSVEEILFHDTVWYAPVPWGGPASYWNIDFGKVTAYVRNNGTLPVQTYELKIWSLYCPGICQGEINLARPVNDVPLQPGQVEKVVFDDNLTFGCTSPKMSLCIWVNGPDDMPDAVPENNRFCKAFAPVLGAEEASQIVNLPVYPNPTSGAVQIPGQESSAAFRLFNSNGQLVQIGTLLDGSLDVSSQPNGLYQLLVALPEKKTGAARFLLIR